MKPTIRITLLALAALVARGAAAETAPPSHREAFERLQIDRAIQLAESELATQRRELGPDHPEIAATLESLAEYLAMKPDYEAAESRARAAVALARSASPSNVRLLVRCLRRLGLLLAETGALDEADASVQEAFSLIESVRGATSDEVLDARIDVARVLLARGKSIEAGAFLGPAVESIPGDSRSDQARRGRALRWLAQAQIGTHEFERAEAAARESLQIRRRLSSEPGLDVAESLSVLVEVFHEQRFLKDARAYAEEALAIRRRLLPSDHPLILADVHTLAVIEMSMGRFADAEPRLREVLEHEKRQLGERHPEVAVTMFTLGINLSEQRRYTEARPLYQEALDILRAADPEHPDIRWVLDYWARDANKQGDFDRAEALYREVLEFIRRTEGYEAPHILVALASVCSGRRDFERAEEYLLEAVRAHEIRRPGWGSGTTAALSSSPYPLLVLVQLERQRELRAWRTLEQSRGRLLRESLCERHGWPAGVPRPDESSCDFAYPLERVQATLDADTAIVGWHAGSLRDRQLRAWGYVVRDRGPVRWVRLDLGPATTPAELHAPFARLRQALARVGESALAIEDRSFESHAGDVGRAWFGPLEPLLEGAKRLILVPSEVMASVPVEVLLDRSGRSVGERFAISYAPSATVHAWLTERPGRSGPVDRALLVGDPPFREQHLQAMAQPEDAAGVLRSDAVDESVLRSAADGDREAMRMLPRLTWSRREVTGIARRFPEPTVLVGPDASERLLHRLAAEDLRRFEVLHFATHAFVDRQRPDCSSLILSQLDSDLVKASSCEEAARDGRLTGFEVAEQWRLDARLVTLSACETGLGRASDGGEGVIGLAYPLIQAGAHSVLASLWKVDDQATALLMERFYEEWLGGAKREGGKAAALRRAKLWLRDHRDAATGRRPFEHPYYWSGFVMVGESD